MFRKNVKNLPAEVQDAIHNIALFSEAKGLRAFVVGGIVRDLFLNGNSLIDLDIVIEGDAVDFARKFAAKTDSEFKKHGQFGTAIVNYSKTLSIDFITAREETYASPGALPDVTPKLIQEDLARRDFTINAMALPITTEGFGELLDPFQGKKDLENQVIRVLHPKSFIDDPTRIFRGIRYLARFDFHFSEETEALLNRAIENKLLLNISNFRIKRELIKVLKEPDPAKTLELLEEYNILQNLNHPLTIHPDFIKNFENLQYALTQISILIPEHEFESWVVYLLALIQYLPGNGAHQFLEAYIFSKSISKRLYELENAKQKNILSFLSESDELKNSTIYFLLENYSIETNFVLLAIAPDQLARNRILFYLKVLRDVEIHLNGKDLQEKISIPPGPIIGELLKRLKIAALDNQVSTQKEELEFVKELWENHQKDSKKKIKFYYS